MDTDIIDEISRVTPKGQELSVSERRDVTIGCLNERVDERRGDDANPFVVDKGERLWPETLNDASGDSQSQQKCREC